MKLFDLAHFGLQTVNRSRLRSSLILLAMSIGVAAVITLTALGEGARRYVTGEFASLGTNLLIVLPGRNETRGGAPPMLAETPRDLTLEDALALKRSRHVKLVAPISVGNANVSVGRRNRETMVLGSTADMFAVRNLKIGTGRTLPLIDPNQASPVVVLGGETKSELFGAESAIGRWLRIGDRRFRVIGVLASEGESVGLDLDNVAIVPLASAQTLFNRSGLYRVLVTSPTREQMPQAEQAILKILRERHDGEEDITVLTQDAILATFDKILNMLTLAVGGIAATSLLVAGILIMNVTLVAVSQRTSEIGVLKAIGASATDVRQIFLGEALTLAILGAFFGLLLGLGAIQVGRKLYPSFPMAAPMWAIFGAVFVAIACGVGFALMPATRAAKLDPVQALTGR